MGRPTRRITGRAPSGLHAQLWVVDWEAALTPFKKEVSCASSGSVCPRDEPKSNWRACYLDTATHFEWDTRGTEYFLEDEECSRPGRFTRYRDRRLILNMCLVQTAPPFSPRRKPSQIDHSARISPLRSTADRCRRKPIVRASKKRRKNRRGDLFLLDLGPLICVRRR